MNSITRPLAIFLSYHFLPSIQVGARRVASLVARLAHEGCDIAVVSNFGGNPNSACSGDPESVVKVYIADRPMNVLRKLVGLKNALASLLPQRGTSPNVASAHGDIAIDTPLAPFKDESMLSRIATLIDECKLWSLRASFASIEAGGQVPKIVIGSGPPMTSLLAALRLAGRLRCPFVADLRDPWFTGVAATGYHGELSAWGNRKLEGIVFRRAQLITVTTEDLAVALRSAYPAIAGKLRVVRNGFDGEPMEPLIETGHRLVILFAGEIYQSRNPFGVLTAIEALMSDPDVDRSRISMIFVGPNDSFGGVRIKDWVVGKRCESVVQVHAAMQRESLAQIVANSTVLLNLTQSEQYSVPAKSYDHIASGRELLILADPASATDRLFRAIPGVNVVDPKKEDALLECLKNLYERHVVQGRAVVPSYKDASLFTRSLQSEEFWGLVAPLLGKPMVN